MKKSLYKGLSKSLRLVLIFAILLTGFQMPNSSVNAASSYLHTTLMDTNNDNIIDSVKLDWVDTLNNEAFYRVERTDSADNSSTYFYTPANTITYSDNVIILGHIYTYKIFSVDTEGNASEYSDTVTLNTSQVVSSNPSTLQLVLKDNNHDHEIDFIKLNWNDASNEAYYRIERKDNTDNTFVTNYSAMNSTQYIDTGVNPLHTYTYKVFSYDSQGNSTKLTDEVTVNLSDIKVPLAPLTVTPVSASQIDLKWTYYGTISYGTVIERRTNGGTWALVGSMENGKTVFSDINLPTNAFYYYRLRSILGSNIQIQLNSDDDSGVGTFTMLNTPMNLYGYALSASRVTLSWSDVQDESGFIIERKDPNAADFVSINNNNPVPANTTTWTDLNLNPDSRYLYRIKAVTSLGNVSLYSDTISIKTTYINPPSTLAALSTPDSEVKLSWRDNSSTESGFEIWRKTNKDSIWVNYASVGRNVINFTDKDIVENLAYFYKIRAKSSYDDVYSNFSNEANTSIILLNSPTNLQANIFLTNRIDLTWIDNSSTESGFKIERKTGLEGMWYEMASLGANITNWSDINVEVSKQYFYRIKAYENSFYNSFCYSEEIEVDTELPVAPMRLSVLSLSPTQIKLNWTDDSNNESGFIIERRADNNSSYFKLVQIDKNMTSFTDNTVLFQRKYFYRVKAYNKLGESAYSNETSAVTKQVIIFKDVPNIHWASKEINNLAGGGAFKSKAGGLFEPDKKVTRGEFVYTLVRTFKLTATPVGSFNDVNSKNTFYREIMIANKMGVISPNKNNYFYPNSLLSREDMVLFLSRALKAADKSLPPHDASILEEYADKNSLAKGVINYFSSVIGEKIMIGKLKNGEHVIAPKDISSRAEAAVVVYKALQALK